jgi:hypothetical protein
MLSGAADATECGTKSAGVEHWKDVCKVED